MLVNQEELENALTTAGSDYAYENDDKYWSVTVEINCDDGWVKAKVLKGGKQ